MHCFIYLFICYALSSDADARNKREGTNKKTINAVETTAAAGVEEVADRIFRNSFHCFQSPSHQQFGNFNKDKSVFINLLTSHHLIGKDKKVIHTHEQMSTELEKTNGNTDKTDNFMYNKKKSRRKEKNCNMSVCTRSWRIIRKVPTSI